MKTDTTKTKELKKPDCECGCGATTAGGRFLPGHDGRLKSALVTAALGGDKRAATKLETLGWTKFLDAKREKLAKGEPKTETNEGKGRKRGRQPKGSEAAESVEAPRRRGRPRKVEASVDPEQSGTEQSS